MSPMRLPEAKRRRQSVFWTNLKKEADSKGSKGGPRRKLRRELRDHEGMDLALTGGTKLKTPRRNRSEAVVFTSKRRANRRG